MRLSAADILVHNSNLVRYGCYKVLTGFQTLSGLYNNNINIYYFFKAGP